MSEINTGTDNLQRSRSSEPYILFDLAGTVYGIHSRNVLQMEMIESITPVPNAPHYVEGVMFSRGQVIPVINLRLRLGMERKENNLRSRVIVIRHEGRTAGLIVDSAREYISLPAEIIQTAPEFMTGLTGQFLGGIAKLGDRIILIFNAEGILKNEQTIEPVNQDKEV